MPALHRWPVTRRLARAATWLGVATAAGLAVGCGSKIPDPPEPTDSYVALGDSYTSGPGIPVVVQGPCFRSSNNYPHQVAAALPDTTLTDVSCAGAATRGLTNRQPTGLSIEQPQLDAVTAATDLVTLSIGANDSHFFSSVVVGCTLLRDTDPTGAPCRDRYVSDGQNKLLPVVDETERQIETMVRLVRDRAPEARILLVGYPQMVPASGTCDLLPLATGDYLFVRTSFQRVIDAQRRAAAATGVEYVDVQAVVAGHDICAADPWIAGVVDHPGEAAAWHPYVAEQAAVADEILRLLK
ncbi:MAG: hypothetical protein JWO11_4377 [Nocardioides sp.]|nr:hypothetical protein [Nocardioides sp.]